LHANGRKPLPPAPKEEAKKSILDRIVKPGEKAKKAIATGKIPDNHIVLNPTKQEKIIKKVKPNPENNHTNLVHKTAKNFEEKPRIPAPPTVNHEIRASSTIIEESQAQPEDPHDAQKSKVRCRNWPACKNESCQYHHPSENCKNFPACRFGDKCLYIHPAIPCKFGAYCQRPNCVYVHPKIPPQMQYYGFGAKPKRQYQNHIQVAPMQQGQQVDSQTEGQPHEE